LRAQPTLENGLAEHKSDGGSETIHAVPLPATERFEHFSGVIHLQSGLRQNSFRNFRIFRTSRG
jgi:hypothetical protein